MKKSAAKQKPEGHSRCNYRHGEARCFKWAMGASEFCSEHSLPMSADEAAEANAFGLETSLAMREELGVLTSDPDGSEYEEDSDNDLGCRPGRKANKMDIVDSEPEVPEAAIKDPIKYAMDMAMEEVAKAYSDDNDSRANGRNPGMRMSATARARMSLAAYMPELDDPAAMVSRNTGKSLVRPGWIPRWVRDKDEDGRPNSRRVRSFQAQGAEDVKDDDGRPLIGRLGRAMQIPPELYAARVLQHSPTGAFDASPAVQNAMDVAEETNRKAGRRVVDVRPTSEHGSRKGDW